MARDFLTIVSGLPRSGTSMMMRMLDLGGIPALTDNLRPADEDNPLGYYEFEPVKRTRQDPSWLEGSEGKAVKMVHLLLLDLPTDRPYRVVFMRRHLREVVASQNVMLRRKGRASDGLSEDKLIAMFEDQIRQVESHLAAHANFRLLEINYNDALRDPMEAALKLDAFLGGGLDIRAMVGVVDPSLYRQRH